MRTATPKVGLSARVQDANARLDAHVRDIIEWHFIHETGCPFWLDFASRLNWDPRREVHCFADLRKFPPFEDEWLRGGPIRRWVPKGLAHLPAYVFETGGTTGVPKSRVAMEDFRIDYEMFSETVPSNNPIDLQSLRLIDFHLLRRSAQQRLFPVLGTLTSMLKTSAQLRLENLALRQQLTVLRRSAPKRLRLTPADRIFWVWLRRVWSDWKAALMIVKAETVVAWHRKGFRLFWRWKIGRGKPGRPSVPQAVRDLIRMMSRNNPRWGAPRVHGELLKLGIEITEPTVAKYMVRRRKPPSQTWRTFLDNHLRSLVSVDFFTVPVRFQVLYVFLVLAHDRRRILHFGVTAHPTAEWTAQQLREAFPWESVPRYLLRDRDQIFGKDFVDQVKALGIKQVLSAPRSPWQRAYVERLIGSIRRECLDHVIVFGEGSLHRTLTAYCAYYHRWRTHLALGKDAPQSRRIQPPAEGAVVELREVGGLHHHYERRAA